jgi:hypothetical protein
VAVDTVNSLVVMSEDKVWPEEHVTLAYVVWLNSTGEELHRFEMYGAPYSTGLALSSVDGTVYATDIAENQILLFHAPSNLPNRRLARQTVME